MTNQNRRTVARGIRIDEETLAIIKVKAARTKRTLNQWINKAIAEKLNK